MLPETSQLLFGEPVGYPFLLNQRHLLLPSHSLSHGDKTMMYQTKLNPAQRAAKEIQPMLLLRHGMVLSHSLSLPLMKDTVVGTQIH